MSDTVARIQIRLEDLEQNDEDFDSCESPARFAALLRLVESLQTSNKLKLRDQYEVATLRTIIKAKSVEAAQEAAYRRLRELYVANTRTWQEANYIAREEDEHAIALDPPKLPVAAPQPLRRRRRKPARATDGAK